MAATSSSNAARPARNQFAWVDVALVPLGQVATVEAGVGPQQIERSSLERQISISAGVLPGFAMGNVADAARARLDSVGLPPGYRTHFGGDVKLEERIKDDLGVTVRCIPLEKSEPGTCPFTGQPSAQRVVWAKAY